MVAVGTLCGGRVRGGSCPSRPVCVGGGAVTDLDRLYLYLEHAREDYQFARTFHSATGVTYTPESIEKKRARVAELEAAVEDAINAQPKENAS